MADDRAMRSPVPAPRDGKSVSATPESLCAKEERSNTVDDQKFLNAVQTEAVRMLGIRENAFRDRAPESVTPQFQESIRRLRQNLAVVNARVSLAPGRPLDGSFIFQTRFPALRVSATMPSLDAPTRDETREFERTLRQELAGSRDEAEIEKAHQRLKDKATLEIEKLISSNPYLGYLPNANPSPAQLAEAQRKHAGDLTEAKKKLESLKLGSPEARVLSQFSPAVLRVLKKDPSLCASFTSLSERVRADAHSRRTTSTLTSILSHSACGLVTLASAGWGAPCFLVGGALSGTVSAVNASSAHSDLSILDAGSTGRLVARKDVTGTERDRNALVTDTALNSIVALSSVPSAVNTLRPLAQRLAAEADSAPTGLKLLTSHGQTYSYNGQYLRNTGGATDSSRSFVQLREEFQRAPLVAKIENGRIVQETTGKPFQFGQDPLSRRLPSPLARRMANEEVRAIFVIDRNGRLMVHPSAKRGVFHHNSFTGGDSVIAAGEMILDSAGRVRMISNGSGHYLPPHSNIDEVVRYLQAHGLSVKPGKRITTDRGFQELLVNY